jgi:hypothetical protein
LSLTLACCSSSTTLPFTKLVLKGLLVQGVPPQRHQLEYVIALHMLSIRCLLYAIRLLCGSGTAPQRARQKVRSLITTGRAREGARVVQRRREQSRMTRRRLARMRAHHSPRAVRGMEVPATSWASVSYATISWVSVPWPENAIMTTSSVSAAASLWNPSWMAATVASASVSRAASPPIESEKSPCNAIASLRAQLSQLIPGEAYRSTPIKRPRNIPCS